jgi:bacteriorhodopsin
MRQSRRGIFMNIQRIILLICTAIGLVVGIIGSVTSGKFEYTWVGIGGGVMLSYLIGKILEEGFSGIIEEGFVGFFLWFIIFGVAGPIGFIIRFKQIRD